MLLHSSISVQIEQNAVKFKIAPRKHESIFNFFFANNKFKFKIVLSLNNTVCDNYTNYTNKHVTKRT